ncbi:transcriptional regulator [Acaryochloris sp. 'Moss Beach']|uniref:transcriptional regulator n=1 Tax=Acaryochloris sp. 'Moss Beach' TaxID=2740837 RepID=UPI001F2F65AC|nr:transcriptional regulator [Acaryochloris sp. 'Moss Beach']
MSKPTQYNSDVFAVIHESMEALHQIDAISKTTMGELDETCLTPIQPIPEDIRALQERGNASQFVFAATLMFPAIKFLNGREVSKKQSGAAIHPKIVYNGHSAVWVLKIKN